MYYYDGSPWKMAFIGGSHEFLDRVEMMIDARTQFHYYATCITPAMTKPKVGAGSAYAFTERDSNWEYLDGGNTYKITLPSPVPVNKFWAFTVYSGQTRSMLETDHLTAGADSNAPDLQANDDESYTVRFSPEEPEDKEGNWVQTVPGKSWNVILRMYSPLEPWFDATWQPGDFELVT
jgi:hypothetical protein